MSCSDCNVNCSHCYISYTGNFSAEDLKNTVLLLSERYDVRINGAEPLIHPDYLDSYAAIRQYGPLTNGLVFRDNYNYLDDIKNAGMKEIHISYHFDFHDKVSIVSKSYLEELFKEISRRGLDLILMCTLTKENYKSLDLYCSEAVRFGAKKIKFTNFVRQGNAKNLQSTGILSESDLKEFFVLLKEARLKYSKSILEIKRCGSFGPDLVHPSNFKCVAGIDNVYITPDFKVYPCIFLAKPGMEIGYFDGKRIFISENYINDGTKCLATEYLNK